MVQPALLHTLSGICQLASTSLLSTAWQAALLALAVALSLRILPGTTAAIRSAAWTAVLIVFTLLPFLSVWVATPAHAASGAPSTLHLDLRWSFAFAALWAALSLIRAVRLSSSAIRVCTIWRRATPVSPVYQDSLQRRCLPGKRSRSAELCTSADVTRPSVIGFFAPRILIPGGLYERLSPVELAHIVAHEMEHLRRRDDWANLLQNIGLVLFPLNPALLWVERRLCLERELACDEGVLRATDAPKSYATCLVNLAEHHMRGREISLALGAWGRKSELARRVHHILDPRETTMGRKPAMAFTALLITSLVCGAAALARSPQLVSFAAQPSSPAGISLATARLTPAFGYQPAGFHNSAVKKPAFVEAVMHVPASPRPGKSTSSNRAHMSFRHSAAQRMASRTPVILTSWSFPPEPFSPQSLSPKSRTTSRSRETFRSQRIALAVFDSPQMFSSYAAVSTVDGWVVFQL